jgi:hypothetical protein
MVSTTEEERGYDLHRTSDIRLHDPEDDLFAAQKGIVEHSVLVNVTFAGDGLICDTVQRTEKERDLLRVEGGSDVGGDDRLRVDACDNDAEETIDDSRE